MNTRQLNPLMTANLKLGDAFIIKPVSTEEIRLIGENKCVPLDLTTFGRMKTMVAGDKDWDWMQSRILRNEVTLSGAITLTVSSFSKITNEFGNEIGQMPVFTIKSNE